MQLTARPQRTSSTPANATVLVTPSPSALLVHPSKNDGTPTRANRQHSGTGKYFHHHFFSRTHKFIKVSFRRTRYQWALLSTLGKVATLFVGIPVGLYVLLTLWDSAFCQVGISSATSYPLSSTETSFSVVINTYKRPDRLKTAVQHYASICGKQFGVSQVFVVWAEQDSQAPSPESFFADSVFLRQGSSSLLLSKHNQDDTRAEVQVLQKQSASLNTRFEPIPQSHSTAIFMVDDDLRVDCRSLQTAFEAWKANPDSMVGYYPRLASVPRRISTTDSSTVMVSSPSLVYHPWPVVFMQHSFNFVLTKACFLHSKYLVLYTNDQTFPRAIKDHIDQHKNCEDIAMSMLVANYTFYYSSNKKPAQPIYVEGTVRDSGLFGGISTGSGHMTTRSDCLTQLTRIFQQHGSPSPLHHYSFPLEGPNVWVHHKPGFWWQYRPSNFFEWFAFANTFT